MKKDEFLGHPKGLAILFCTEMWERFSYYGIRSILVLYMVSKVANGGLGWTDAEALSVFGTYQFFAALTAIPGGMIADRWLGQRLCAWIGCLLISIGNFTLVMPGMSSFYAGLALIAIGGGCLKPNISTMVSRLYKPGDPRRESGFTLFYLSVNIGACASGFIVGFLAQKYGWRMGFLASGIGMLFGQFMYMFGQRYLKSVDTIRDNVQKVVTEKAPLTKNEIRRLVIILISFICITIFFTAYEQCGGLLNIYTDRFTDRTIEAFTIPFTSHIVKTFEIPAASFQSLNPFFVIVLAPLIAAFWTFLGKRGKDLSAFSKMGLGAIILGVGYLFMLAAIMQRDASPAHLSSMSWIVLVIFMTTIGELALAPVSLSFITATAPQRIASMVLGLYIATAGISGWCAAKVGALAQGHGEKTVFLGLAAVTILVGSLQMIFSKRITRGT